MKTFMLTFDVEQNCPPFDNGYEGVRDGMPKILDMLDELNIKATMFITGRSAELYPKIIKRVAKKHEIQCHTYNHEVLENLSYEEQKKSILKCKKILENLTGKKINGFRAPYARFNKTTFKVLHDLNFRYDSSVMSRTIVGKGLTEMNKINRNILQFLLYPDEKIKQFNENMIKIISKANDIFNLDRKNKLRILYYGLTSIQNLPRKLDNYINSLGLEEIKITLRSMYFRSPTFNSKLLKRNTVVAYLHPWEFINIEKYLDIKGILLFEWLFSGNKLSEIMKKRLENLKKSGYNFMTISDYLNKNKIKRIKSNKFE